MLQTLSVVLMATLVGLSIVGCSKDSCEVDSTGPECQQTFTLDLPANCPQMTVTLNTFHDRIINAKCATTACHGGSMFPTYGPSKEIFLGEVLRTSPSRNAMPSLKYVKPGDPHNSFLLYKVIQAPTTGMTQEGKIQLGGGSMPQGQALLTAEEQCTLINWVLGGATDLP